MEAKNLALAIAAIAREKKAERLTVLDMRSVCSFCDYFVIASANSLRQTNATAEAIRDTLEKDKIRPLSLVTSNDESGWIVLDYLSVIVHIFHKPVREFYSLERLWSDALRIRLPAQRRVKPR